MGLSNLVSREREADDYYATDPLAAKLLLDLEELNNVWEPAVGAGHLAKVFDEAGILSKATDLVDRGYGEVQEFLSVNEKWLGDIVTNPPYKLAQEFIEHALELVEEGNKVVMFLPVRYLESKRRKLLFEKFPPKTVYVSSSRISSAKNGNFEAFKSSTVAYTWFLWVKGYEGTTELKWFN